MKLSQSDIHAWELLVRMPKSMNEMTKLEQELYCIEIEKEQE